MASATTGRAFKSMAAVHTDGPHPALGSAGRSASARATVDDPPVAEVGGGGGRSPTAATTVLPALNPPHTSHTTNAFQQRQQQQQQPVQQQSRPHSVSERSSASDGTRQRHKRNFANPVSRTRKPAWNNLRGSDPLFGGAVRGGLPSSYRPHPSESYGTLEYAAGVPTSRPDVSPLSPGNAHKVRQRSLDESELNNLTANTKIGKDRNTSVRPALPYQVTWDETTYDKSVRNVGVQSAATTWTRFFHGRDGTDTGMRKSNPFYQHFDVYLDPDPLGPIHIASSSASAAGGPASIRDQESGIKLSREEMETFYRRSYERLYFLTGTEPADLFVDTLNIGEDIKQGWPAPGQDYEMERLNLVEYIRYVARLHPRSGDDMKSLMRLQNGLLRHVQQELMDHEKEMAERVKMAMERLTGNRDDRLTTLQLTIMQLENELKREQEGRRKAETQKQLLVAARDVLRIDNQGLKSNGESLEQRLWAAEERIRSLEASLADHMESATLAGSEIESLKKALEEEMSLRQSMEADLQKEREKSAKREEELLQALSSMVCAGNVDVPSMRCYLPTLTEVHTTQLATQTYAVSLPADARVYVPPTCVGLPGLRPGGAEKLVRTLGEAPDDVLAKAPIRREGVLTKVVPSGAIVKFPRGPWEYGVGSAVYEDTGAIGALPVGSIAVIPLTLRPSDAPQAEGTAAAEPELVYRLRAIQAPGGSLLILPNGIHPGVDLYVFNLPATCTIQVSQSLVQRMGATLSGVEPGVSMTAHALAEMCGWKRNEDGSDNDGEVQVQLTPGSLIHLAGGPTLAVRVPEGSTVVLGPGEASKAKEVEVRVDTAELDALRDELTQVQEELFALRVANFPLELLRTRLRHVLTHLSRGVASVEEGVSALSASVLVELFREEPRRVSGQCIAVSSLRDAPPGGVICFEGLSYRCVEKSGGLNVVLKRIGGSTGRVGVLVNTVDGSGSGGADYKPIVDLAVTWEDGDASDRAIPVSVYDDNFLEDDETFFVCITDVLSDMETPFAIGLNDTCEVVIVDDDQEPEPGQPMRWDDVVQGGPMPWDKKDCVRTLALPAGFDTGAYRKWVEKLQSGAEPNLERLRSLVKNLIQTKINNDALDDSRGNPRDSFAEQYRSYIEYTYGTEFAAKKHSLVLAKMRYAYRLTMDPFISLAICMIGYFDACPARVSDLACKIFSLAAEGLMLCEFSASKFWSRFSEHLKMTPNEMRAMHSKLYDGNKLVKHSEFLLDDQSEDLKSLQSMLIEKAGEVDESLDAEHVTSLSDDQKPTIPVADVISMTLQHGVQMATTLRPVLFSLVRKHAELDKGIKKLSYSGFCQVVDVVEQYASEERKMAFFRKSLNMDVAPRKPAPHAGHPGTGKKNRRKSNTTGYMKPLTPLQHLPEAEEERAEPEAGDAAERASGTDGSREGSQDGEAKRNEGVVVVGDATDNRDGDPANPPRLPYKPWAQVVKMKANADVVANVLYQEIDFVFLSSNSSGLNR